MNKICNKCKIEKDINDFHLIYSDKSQRRGRCKICENEANKISRSLDLQKHRDYANRLYAKRKAKGLIINRYDSEIMYEKYRKNIIYYLIVSAKRRAKLKNIEFNLNQDLIMLPTHCPILGIPLIISTRVHSANSPSLDRIDNTKGYTNENVIIISYKANQIKNIGTAEEHKKIAEWMDTKLSRVY